MSQFWLKCQNVSKLGLFSVLRSTFYSFNIKKWNKSAKRYMPDTCKRSCRSLLAIRETIKRMNTVQIGQDLRKTWWGRCWARRRLHNCAEKFAEFFFFFFFFPFFFILFVCFCFIATHLVCIWSLMWFLSDIVPVRKREMADLHPLTLFISLLAFSSFLFPLFASSRPDFSQC